MPIYEYICPKCSSKFELMRPMSQSEEEAACAARLDEERVALGRAQAPAEADKDKAPDKRKSVVHTNQTIERTLKGLGVKWLRTVHTYRVPEMIRTLREAFTTPESGLKVIVAEGECQLERQRRIRPVNAAALKNDLVFFQQRGLVDARASVDAVIDHSFAEEAVRVLGPYRGSH